MGVRTMEMVAAEAGVLAVQAGTAQAEAQAAATLWTLPVAVEAAVEAARREAQLVLLMAGTAATIILALEAARAAAPTRMVQWGLQVGAVAGVGQILDLVERAGRALSGQQATDRAAAVEAVPLSKTAVSADFMAAAVEGLVVAPLFPPMAHRASS
ncbi:hypothetical protein [Candidatus Binatus sp.]|uniref:hypothetical protein n=2 Tax=Candidatus Binatus sp. TaxID=2811406 RepID=UPI003C40228C